MPGIVGLITKRPREWAEPQLVRMVQALRHETSYVTGTWVNESLGIYAGWAIRRGSFSDGMPVSNERGDVVLVFCGEDYPEPGTACRLKAEGHRFNEDGPDYLVHLYEENQDFLARLNGRFQGLLIDRTAATATLFNDRYAMQRMYYHESAQDFYFAAEAKAILAVRPELRTIELQSLGEYVACGCVLENRTLFKGIRVLPPASAWVFRHRAIERKSSYFRRQDWENQEPLDSESYYQQIREVFSRNLPRYFSSKERIAVSLTGGLDTRMIMAWQTSLPASLPCYSFGGMFRDCQDVIMAREVARACGQPHEVIPLGEEFLSRFSHYAERTVYLTDGCVDVNHSPDLYVNERAAEFAPVRMTGNYGGEVLRRVRAFKPIEPAHGLFENEFLHHIHVAGHTYAALLSGHPLSFAVFRQAPWHHYGLLALEQTQLCVRSPYLDNDFVRTVFRAPESALANNDLCLRLVADGNLALRRIRTDRGVNGSPAHLSATVRRALLEFTFKAEYAYDYGMPQWVAQIDHLFSPLHLERLFLGRHKFYHFRIWYRDALSNYVREILLDQRALSRPYWEAKRLKEIVNSHIKGNRNYTTEIHKVLTLELLHRIFIDGNDPRPSA